MGDGGASGGQRDGPGSGVPRAAVLGVALVMLAAAAVRLAPVRQVLGPDRVNVVGDGDAVYHLWRTQRTAETWPRPLWFDPGLDHPYGARIPWPPLFDELGATAAVLTPGGAAPDHVARVAALVPVVLAVLTVPIVAALGAALLGDGVAAALIASLLPVSVHYGFIGLTDHHVAELLLFTAAALLFVRGWSAGALRVAPALGLGVVLALSFWNWHGSALTLVVLAACAAAIHVWEPEGRGAAAAAEQALGIGAAAAAALLLASVPALGPPGALGSFELSGIGGLSVVVSAGVVVGCAALLALGRLRRGASGGAARRAGEVAVAGLLAGALPLVVPGASAGVLHGLSEAGAANSFYATIGELQPVLFSGRAPLRDELAVLLAMSGLSLLLLPAAAKVLVAGWRAAPAGRQRSLFLAVFCVILAALWVARSRFMLYGSVAAALWCALVVRRAAGWLAARARPERRDLLRRAGVLAGCVLVIGPAWAAGGTSPNAATDPAVARLVAGITRIRDAAPRPDAGGVLGPWAFGHALRVAGLPVVATPFGNDIGPRGLADEAAFFLSSSVDEADRVLARRRVRFVVVTAPLEMADALRGFAPPGTPPLVAIGASPEGRTIEPREGLSRTVLARLFFGDGMQPRGVAEPAWGRLRLVREELPPSASGVPEPEQVKTFEVVAGAVLRVERASARVEAEVPVTTLAGRSFRWRTSALPSAGGIVELRVPYATGRTGDVVAGPWTVRSGSTEVAVAVEPGAPERGDVVAVALHPAAPASRR